jgi:hypothetical protein
VGLLIKESEKVVAVAAKIGTIKIDNLTPDRVKAFNAVIAQFDKSIEDFRQFAVRVGNSLTATMTEDVNKVVNAIFERVNGTCQSCTAAPKPPRPSCERPRSWCPPNSWTSPKCCHDRKKFANSDSPASGRWQTPC